MKLRLHAAFVLTAIVLFASLAFAADGSSLKPPAGARVAVVVFEDMECPSCAHAYPVIWQAAGAAHVPVLLHDFPLTKHPWAFDAAVYARFFDTKNTKKRNVGNQFRAFIYQNQPEITPQNLRQWAEKFAKDNHIVLPFAIDPQGTLKAEIQADRELGRKCNLNQTPTIFVVGKTSPSFVEVSDLNTLSTMIDDMRKRAGSASTPAQRAVKKAH